MTFVPPGQKTARAQRGLTSKVVIPNLLIKNNSRGLKIPAGPAARKKSARSNSFVFVRRFLHHPFVVGSILPSSPRLAEAMLEGISLLPGEGILELGPGTGSFTRQIRRLTPDKRMYLGIEKEAVFVELLRKRFPDLRFLKLAAEEFSSRVGPDSFPPIKVIISGLPSAATAESYLDRLVENLDRLMAPGSLFRTFTYLHSYHLAGPTHFRRRMEGITRRYLRSRVILKNIPPAYVLTWFR